jgi:methyl-accepting chemotaxis protein
VNSLLPKFSLKTKTRAVFGLFLLLFVGVAAFAFLALSAVSKQAESAKVVWEARIIGANEILGDARDYRIAEALRLMPSSPEMAAQADEDLKASAERMEKAMADYRSMLRAGEAPEDINKTAALWAEYVAGNQVMLAYVDSGETEAAADRFRNSASSFYLVSDAAGALVTAARTHSAEAYAESLEISERARWGLIGGTALVVFVLLLATVFFEFQVWRELVRMSGVMQRLARGDLQAEVTGVGRHDEVGEMARAVEVFKVNALEVLRLEAEASVHQTGLDVERTANDRRLASEASTRTFVVDQIAQGLERLSRGDLTIRLQEDFPAEFQKLHDDFNLAIETLERSFFAISTGASDIESSTAEISNATDQLARRTEQQAASLEEAAAAMAQFTATVRSSASNAKIAREAVADAKLNAERSGDVVGNAVAAMGEIEKSAQQVSEIIGVMDEIAFQTNLLALNAGVEAARAGDAGRGFAVVASEVRALAQRSTAAAREIKSLISASSSQVSAGVRLVTETGGSLHKIVSQIGEINTAIAGIASAAEEQSDSLIQINMTISQMDKVTQQNAAMAEESTAASHSLAREANDLSGLISQFSISNSLARSPKSEPAARQPVSNRPAPKGQYVLRSLSSGNAALAQKLESVLTEESWEEF